MVTPIGEGGKETMTTITETAIQGPEPASILGEEGMRICTGKLPLVPRQRRWRDRCLVEILEGRQSVLRPA